MHALPPLSSTLGEEGLLRKGGDGHPLNPRHVQGSDGNCGGVEGAWGWLQCEERMKRGRQEEGGLHAG